MSDSLVLLFSFLFMIASIMASCALYAKHHEVSFKDALLVLWNECIVAGVKTARRSFAPTVKAAASAAWLYIKRWAAAFWEYLKPAPMKHVFTPDLYYGLYDAIREYVYAPFQPVIDARYTPYPSAVYVSFYTKSAINEEVATEVCWHIQAKFKEYLLYYDLLFDFTVVPYVQDNRIEVWVHYCEYPEEYLAYRACCRRAMLMKADPAFRPLPESAVPPTADLVLGYRYENWNSSGQVVPIMWDTATAPSILVAGPTGGGKTVYLKLLLERLLLAGVDVTICDYKGYGDLRGFVPNYAAGADCDTALATFCANFEYAMAHGITNERHAILFDELLAFIAGKSKKEAAEVMRSITKLITMARAYGYHVIFAGQRFDADTLDTKLREQFGIKVHMGYAISPQSADMLFPNADIKAGERLQPYCGYISTPKVDKDVLIVPKVDIPALDQRLKELGRRGHG